MKSKSFPLKVTATQGKRGQASTLNISFEDLAKSRVGLADKINLTGITSSHNRPQTDIFHDLMRAIDRAQKMDWVEVEECAAESFLDQYFPYPSSVII